MKGFSKTLDSFIEESKIKHGKETFLYDNVNYVNLTTEVELICNKHKISFKQTPKEHFRSNKLCCSKCAQEKEELESQTQGLAFINESILIHGDKNDYSQVKYVNKTTKVKIICKKHGPFMQEPKSHLKGHGCKSCCGEKPKESKNKGKKRNINTIDSLISEFKEKHGEKYDYSKFVSFKNNKSKIEIICKKHIPFTQSIIDHRNGAGCPKCATEEKAEKFRLDINLLKERFINIHGNKYDYSLITNYTNNRDKLSMICHHDGHGVFHKSADNHLQGQGCPKCSLIEKSKKALISQKEIIKRFKKAYPENIFDYSQVIYKGTENPVTVKCNKPGHVEFEVTPYAHLKGQGCPKCASTKGELKIQQYLEESNLEFIKEKKFPTLMKNTYLRFDFYVEKYNLLIEYDGQQHFSPVKFGGISELKATELFHKAQERDIMKNKFVAKNGLNLLRIPYWDFNNIEDILNNYFAKIKKAIDI